VRTTPAFIDFAVTCKNPLNPPEGDLKFSLMIYIIETIMLLKSMIIFLKKNELTLIIRVLLFLMSLVILIFFSVKDIICNNNNVV
jgi:hypothetical protein